MRKILVTVFAAAVLLLIAAPAHASKLPGGPDDSASPSASVSVPPTDPTQTPTAEPTASPTVTATPTATVAPSPSVSATRLPRPSATPSVSHSPEAAAPSLPVTGTPIGVIVGFGIMAIGAGLGLTVLSRRRRVR